MNKYWRENIATTSDYDIKSSCNQRQLHVTNFSNKFIEKVIEPVDYILDEVKPYISYNYKVTLISLFKKRESEEEKITNANFRADGYMAKDPRLDLNQWLKYSRETYEGYGYDYEFFGVTYIQLKLTIEKKTITRIFY